MTADTLTRPHTGFAAGVYDGVPSEDYHSDPALSASGMRKLLPPSCPALFRHDRDNPPAPKREFDLGHAAHRMVLGAGAELQVCDYADWRSAAAKADKIEAYANNRIPLLPKDMERVTAMAEVLHRHPIASGLFRHGRPEQSLFWTDPVTGVAMRSRLDWFDDESEGRLKITDYKSVGTDLDLDTIERAIYEHGHNQQGAQYQDAVRALGVGDESTVSCLVFQMREAPYLVRVVQITQMALRIGRAKNREATRIFQQCTESGHWPGYDEVAYAGMPAWAETREAGEYL